MSASSSPVIPENGTWTFAPEGWGQLHGSFPQQGISIEWHDFESKADIPWEKSFHDDSIEICLNLTGNAKISRQGKELELREKSVAFYSWRGDGLKATRLKEEKHSFLTVEISKEYLKNCLPEKSPGLCAMARSFLSSRYSSQFSPETRPLNYFFQSFVEDLRTPPVPELAKPIWYQSKILELAAKLFFDEQPVEELFCARQKRVAQERVDKIKSQLSQALDEPLCLQSLSKSVGCSPFYLSRTFSQQTGTTIPKFLRQIRIEKAAELLRTGKFNVTEAAMEVGYSSLSHFTKVFHETMGCCPGLYPFGKMVSKSR